MLRLYSNGMVHGLFREREERDYSVECLLSPKGTYFSLRYIHLSHVNETFYEENNYPHSLFELSQNGWWKQRTAFCLTPYRNYISEMLKFRNMYYGEPYVGKGSWIEQLYPILRVS